MAPVYFERSTKNVQFWCHLSHFIIEENLKTVPRAKIKTAGNYYKEVKKRIPVNKNSTGHK
jgi:hypothetical protein